MGLFKSIGRFLRKNVLNPVKSIVSKTPIGGIIEDIVPGALDPNVNLFADPMPASLAPDPIAAPAPGAYVPPPNAYAGSRANPFGATSPRLSGRTIAVPVEYLQALVDNSRDVDRMRVQLNARKSEAVPPYVRPSITSPAPVAAPAPAPVAISATPLVDKVMDRFRSFGG